MVGDAGANQLLGRPGPDTYFAGAGNDSILANSGDDSDPDPVIDCGEGFDTALIDFPENGPDAAPIGCESVEERAPNSFRPPDTPPDPEPPADRRSTASAPPPPARDRKPPADADRPPARASSLIATQAPAPRRLLLRRQRAGARLPLPARPPAVRRAAPRRAPTGSAPARHVFRVFAIDPPATATRRPARVPRSGSAAR